MTVPPALVVISGGATPQPRAADTVDATLLAALPRARRVLELGGSGDALGREYRRLHPGSSWRNVAIDAQRVAPRGERFDLVVVGDADALPLLDRASAFAAADATLVATIANTATQATLERIVEGDCTDLPVLASPASIYKSLMDAGWMPTLADRHAAAAPRPALAAATHAMADALGVPRATADATLGIERLVIEARRSFADAPPARPTAASFDVVVPTTRERQLALNVERSPGLREVGARIVSYRRAADPAEALERSLAHCDADWVLLCHQDVYFPRGFGLRLNALLDAMRPEQRATTLIGFIGIGADATTQTMRPAGFVIDRLHRADHAACDAAVSIDELAIVIARDSVHRIDPRIGWHLWATELCLASICTHKVLPRIVRLPLFHNSLNDYSLPASFRASAAYLAAKYPGFGPIPTLCGTIDERFLAQAG